jgi:hypothetical protein
MAQKGEVAKKGDGAMGVSVWRWVAMKGEGWLRREMDGLAGRWVAKKGDGWLSRRWVAKYKDGWL